MGQEEIQNLFKENCRKFMTVNELYELYKKRYGDICLSGVFRGVRKIGNHLEVKMVKVDGCNRHIKMYRWKKDVGDK